MPKSPETDASYGADGALAFAGRRLEEIAVRHGSPLFIGSRVRLEANLRAFQDAFQGYGKPVGINYSTKTNNNLGILEVLRRSGADAGVCSGLDYAAARAAGFPPERITFDGLAKQPEELRQAIRDGVRLINAESLQELRLIHEISKELGRVTPVGLRVHPGSSGAHSLSAKSLLGISYDRFGFDLRSGRAAEALDQAQRLPNLRVEGLHIHDSSHLTSSRPFIERLQALRPLIRKLSGRLKVLNLGGGFGSEGVKPRGAGDLARMGLCQLFGKSVPLDRSGRRVDLRVIGSEIAREVARLFKQEGLPLPDLAFEPGRAIVGSAFLLLCTVVLRKEVPGSGTWLVLDAGTNLFPALLTFTEQHRILPLTEASGAARERAHLAGPLLYSSDILMKNCPLPRMEAGSRLVLLDAGAYTLAYSNQFLYPRPAVVLIEEGGHTRVIREAETAEEVLRMDRI